MTNRLSTTDEPRQVLARLLQDYGRELADQPRRLEGLLRDYCPTRRREISALVAAQKERVLVSLATLQEQVPVAIIIARLARQLHDHVGLTEPLAYWAVESWALALGVLSEPISAGLAADDNLAGETSTSMMGTATVLENPTAGVKIHTVSPETGQTPLDRAAAALERAQVATIPEESLRLAELARELALATLREGSRTAAAQALVTQSETVLLRAAAICAEQAEQTGRLGVACVYWRAHLELQPQHAEARSRFDGIRTKRAECLRPAEERWKACKPSKAIALLEQALEVFPDDPELREQVEHWKQVAARVDQTLNREIPTLKTQKHFHKLSIILAELQQLDAPVKGLAEYSVAVENRIRAIEPAMHEARLALERQDHLAAIWQCDKVLAIVADYPQAWELRNQATAALDADQQIALTIQAAMQAGQWALASQRLAAMGPVAIEQPPFDALQREVTTMQGRIVGYWRFLGAAFGGALLWILAGWLGGLANQGLAKAWPQHFQGWPPPPLLLACICLMQLLLAAFLLGFGGVLLAGRRALESIPWNCGVAGIGAVLVGSSAIVMQHASIDLLAHVWVFLYALSAGMLIGFWLRSLPGIPRSNLVVSALAGAAMTCAQMWLGSLANNSPMHTCIITVINLCAALAVVGVVHRWWWFALIPVGVLLACGLSTREGLEASSPWLVSTLIGLTLAGSVLALSAKHLSWAAMIGVIVTGVAVALATHKAWDLSTVPQPAVLLSIWSTVIFVQAIRSASPSTAALLWLGLRYAADSWLHQPTDSDSK